MVLKFLYYLIFAISLFPFPGHLTVLVLLSTITLIIFFTRIIEGSTIIYQYEFRKNKYYLYFMLLLFLYSLISIIWSKDFSGWIFYNIYLYIAAVMLIITVTFIKDKDNFLEILDFISYTSIIHNIIGWINIIFNAYIFSTSPLIKDFQEKGNPLSLFNNTNDFATFLVFSFFINIVSITNSNSKTKKGLLNLNLISTIILLYRTMSRANYLALIFGLVVFVVLLSKKEKIFSLFSLILGGVGISVFLIPDVFEIMYSFIFQNLLNSGDMIRINLIKNGFVFLKESYGFGIGAGNIPYYLQNNHVYSNFNVNSIHNWWLDILVTYGVLMFILYLVYYLKLFIDFLSKINYDDRFFKLTSISFISILTAYIIGSNSTSSNFPIIWIWNVFSVMIAFVGIDVKNKKLNKEK